jgi:L,D-peptidoglycan transpeptidase YkuD (ErfK/YbiS/YcfS/YnhG family)
MRRPVHATTLSVLASKNARVLRGRVRRILAASLVFALSASSASASPRGDGASRDLERRHASPIDEKCRQLLVVRTASWSTSRGTLERYERPPSREDSPESRPWKRVGEPFAVSLGRNGMAWGRGLQAGSEPGPSKREGDGRSPAGAFALGRAFGIAAALPAGSHRFPYLPTQASTYCVEDVGSVHYNEIVDAEDVKPRSWERWSELRRSDGLFDWGVIVRQNEPNTKKGAGSCVFLHIWRGPQLPTAGCTAMAKDSIAETVTWLEPEAAPVLVQLPVPVFETLRDDWGLPGST